MNGIGNYMEKNNFYNFLKYFLKWLYKIWFNPKIIGENNIPKNEAVILAGNHIHLLDPCNSIIATKRYIHFLAKKELFHSKIGNWFFTKFGSLPIDRNGYNIKTIKKTKDILNNGGVIGIFPEGTRNRTNNILLPFKDGVVSLAYKTNAWIVPYSIIGTYKFRSKNLRIVFGKPYKVTTNKEEENQVLYQKIKELIIDGRVD